MNIVALTHKNKYNSSIFCEVLLPTTNYKKINGDGLGIKSATSSHINGNIFTASYLNAIHFIQS